MQRGSATRGLPPPSAAAAASTLAPPTLFGPSKWWAHNPRQSTNYSTKEYIAPDPFRSFSQQQVRLYSTNIMDSLLVSCSEQLSEINGQVEGTANNNNNNNDCFDVYKLICLQALFPSGSVCRCFAWDPLSGI